MKYKPLIWIIVIIVISYFAILVYASSGTTAFIIENATGTAVATFWDNGTVVFNGRCLAVGSTCDVTSGDCITIGDCSNNAPSNSFQLENTSIGITTWISNNGFICTNGSIDESHSMTGVCATPAFNITDNTGSTKACIDVGGNLYTRDRITCGTCGADCGAGVCSGLGICTTGEACDNDNDCTDICDNSNPFDIHCA